MELCPGFVRKSKLLFKLPTLVFLLAIFTVIGVRETLFSQPNMAALSVFYTTLPFSVYSATMEISDSVTSDGRNKQSRNDGVRMLKATKTKQTRRPRACYPQGRYCCVVAWGIASTHVRVLR